MLFEISVPNRDSAELTLSSFLIIDLYATCIGVYQYQRADGQLVNEHKSIDEIARPVTLQSILGCPLSIHHPPDFFSPENFNQWPTWAFVGVFIEPGKMDGRRVKTRAIVYSRDAIDAIWEGRLTEISMGSWHQPVAQSGEFEGLQYSVLQTWIYFNHGSLYEPGGGRLGAEVGVSFDGKELSYCTHKIPDKKLILPAKNQDSNQPEVIKMLIPLSDGKTVDIPDAQAKDVLAHIQAQDSKIQVLTNDAVKTAAQLAVYAANPPQAQAKDTHNDDAVQERQEIIDSALDLLPENYTARGKANTVIMLDALDVLGVKVPDSAKNNEPAVKLAFDTALSLQPAKTTDSGNYNNVNRRIATDAARGSSGPAGYVPTDKRQDGGRGFTDNDLESMNRHFNSQSKKGA